MRILALDLATRTGWAAWNGTRRESGYVDFQPRRGESSGMRFISFNRWLERIALDGGSPRQPLFDLIVYERPHHRGGAATEIAAGFSTRVQEFCARHGIELAGIHTAQLKRFATGKGNADKALVVFKVRERWAPDVVSDDEADAIAALYYALTELVPAGA